MNRYFNLIFFLSTNNHVFYKIVLYGIWHWDEGRINARWNLTIHLKLKIMIQRSPFIVHIIFIISKIKYKKDL